MRAWTAIVLTLTVAASACAQGVMVGTEDGLQLEFAPDGTVGAVLLDGEAVPLSGEHGGFLIADMLRGPNAGLSDNLIPDPGFERTQGDDAFWKFVGEWSLDAEQGHEAPPCAKLHVPGTEEVKTAQLTSGRVKMAGATGYLLEYWIKLEGIAGSSRPSLRIEQWDDEGNKTTDFFQITLACPYQGTRDWLRMRHLFTTAPATTNVTFYANLYGGYGTAWFDDVSVRQLQGGLAKPLEGEVTGTAEGATATYRDGDLGIELTADFRALRNNIRCDLELRDLLGEDRGLQVMWRLPLALAGWTWYDDATTPRTVEGDALFENVYRRGQVVQFSQYPWSSVTHGTSGLSLAVPVDVPRTFRLRCNRGGHEVVFDLGLSEATTKFPGRAAASFLLYAHDGTWGFRAATAKYYEVFPHLFESRIKEHGTWFFSLKPDLVPDPESFGLRFDEHGGGHMAYDNEHGIYAFEYTEPWMYKEMLGDIPKEELPDYEQAVARVMKDVAADPEVMQPAYYSGMRRRDAVRSYLQCAFQDIDGKYVLSGSQYYGYYNKMYVVNPDIEIAGEWGQLNRGMISWQTEIMRWIKKAEDEGARFDGVYLDSVTPWWARYENYRRDLYRFADHPLVYNAMTGRIVQWKQLCDYELGQFYYEEMLKRDMYVMANIFAPAHTYFGHLLDMMGAGETDGKKPYLPSHYNYLRALAYHKPLSFMDYAYMDPEFTLEQLEGKLQDCLLYAVFPGTAPFKDKEKIDRIRPLFQKYIPPMRKLGQAGWEPVTYARADPEGTPIERYGPGLPGELCFAFKNAAEERGVITLHIQPDLLGGKPPEALRVSDLFSGEVLQAEAEGNGLKLTKELAAGVTCAIAVTTAD